MDQVSIQSASKIYENRSLRYEYKQRDYVGRGAFGTVYRGMDKEKNEYVALKLINKNLQMTNFEVLLQQEIETLSRLPHNKYLIKYKDYYTTDIHHIIVMEMFDNSIELQQYLENNNGKLGEDHSLEILAQITQGLQALHQQCIAHRDLKPANILIRTQPQLQIKICDFGYAKRYRGADIITQNLAGSPIYMSPQNLFQVGYDPYANDIWSLGIMFYQMITGRFPWKAKTGKDLDSQLLKYIANEIELNLMDLSMYVKEIIIDCLKLVEKERINIQDLKWKVERIIQETLKLSYHPDFNLPKFKWDMAIKPVFKQGFLNEEEFKSITQQKQQENQELSSKVLNIHFRFLEDIITMDQDFVEVEDYLDIFGFVLAKITRQTLDNTIDENKLDKFWIGVSNFLKWLFNQHNDQNFHKKQLKKIQDIIDTYIELEIHTTIKWENDKSFIKQFLKFLQNEINIPDKFRQSFNYMLFLLKEDQYQLNIQKIL